MWPQVLNSLTSYSTEFCRMVLSKMITDTLIYLLANICPPLSDEEKGLTPYHLPLGKCSKVL